MLQSISCVRELTVNHSESVVLAIMPSTIASDTTPKAIHSGTHPPPLAMAPIIAFQVAFPSGWAHIYSAIFATKLPRRGTVRTFLPTTCSGAASALVDTEAGRVCSMEREGPSLGEEIESELMLATQIRYERQTRLKGCVHKNNGRRRSSSLRARGCVCKAQWERTE